MEQKKVTVPDLRARKSGGEKIAMVTAYDFTMARLVDEAGVDMVLVGDSLGMVVQGLSTTTPVTLDEMAYHCRAVARGLARAPHIRRRQRRTAMAPGSPRVRGRRLVDPEPRSHMEARNRTGRDHQSLRLSRRARSMR